MSTYSKQQSKSKQPVIATGWKRLVAWLTISLQAIFPVATTLTPTLMAQAQNGTVKLCQPGANATELYTLQPGETIATVAQRYQMSVAALQVLNANRHFPQGFANLQAGDVIEVPATMTDCDAADDVQTQKLAQVASEAGAFFNEKPNGKDTRQKLNSFVAGQAGQELESWLGLYGTARVQLNADSDFDLNNSEIDLLLPLYDLPQDLFFTQGSIHRTDERNQANLGFGWRHFRTDDMFGANTFIDYDFTREHARFGVGVEYWRDYFKLSANAYQRLTSWKDSDDYRYQDRPANGWDIRAEGYLPAYPQLGGKLMYEQYYGDEVALFSDDARQKDPHAITADITYTPFPLMTFTAEHRHGQDGEKDTSLGVQLNYQLGVPWAKQVDPNAVGAYRSLMGSRYSLVDRNNNIILEYRKKAVVSLQVVSPITGYAGEEKAFEISANSPSGIDRIEWSAPELLANGGKIIKLGPTSYHVILPQYNSSNPAANSYIATAIAYDSDGNASQPQQVQINVLESVIDVAKSSFTPPESTIVADGKSTQTLTLKVVDENNRPVDLDPSEIHLKQANARSIVKNPAISDFKRIEAGVYQIVVSAGNQVTDVVLTPVARKVTFNTATVHIVADKSSMQIQKNNLRIVHNNAISNGVAQNVIEATVTDAQGNAIANETVTVKADHGATVVGSAKTNAKGVVTVPVTNNIAGLVNVTVQVGDSQPMTIQVNFVAEDERVQILDKDIQVIQDNAIANGKAVDKVQVKVTNQQGDVLANQRVSFSVNNQAQLSATEVTTDKNGIATVDITSQTAGSATVTARVADSQAKVDVHFVADNKTATIVSVVPSAGPYLADGKTPVTYQAIVKDSNGNILPGVTVSWQSDKSNITMDAKQSITNENGVALLQITSTKAQTVVITASTADSRKAAEPITFVADQNSETLTNLTADKMTFTANGQDLSTLTATVKDQKGNPLSNVKVSWSADNQANIKPLQQVTDTNGQVKATVDTLQVGSINVTAKLDNGQSRQLTLVAQADVATEAVVLTYDKDSAQADNRDRITFTATVKDANNNPVANQMVSWYSSLNTLSAASGMTNADGQITVTLKGIKAGSATVTASLSNGKSAQQTVSFTALAPDKNLSKFVIEPKQVVADGQSIATGKVTLRDSNGNPVTDQAITFRGSDPALHFSTVTEVGNGVYTVEMTSLKAMHYGVMATFNGQDLTASVTFIANEDTAHITLKADRNTLIADNKDTVQLTALVQDKSGNPVSGQKVSWSATHDAKVTVVNAVTDSKGIAKANLVTAIAGAIDVTAQLENGNYDVASLIASGDINSATVQLRKDKGVAQADGQDSIRFLVTVKDANNNALADQTVTFKTTLNKLSATTAQTDAEGHATVSLSGTQAGGVIVTAVLNGGAAAQQVAVFVAQAPDQQQSKFVITPNSIVADGTTTATGTVTITDQYGNPIIHQKLQFSDNHNGLRFTDITEQGHGVYTVKISGKQADSYSVSAKIIDNSDFVLNAPLTLTADTDSAQIVDGNLTVISDNAVADGQASNKVRAIVTDNNGNRLANQIVTFTADHGAQITGSVKTNSQGEAEASLTNTQSGKVKVTAQVAQSAARSVMVNFVADNNTAQIATGDLIVLADNAIANGEQRDVAQVKVTDANGNPISNITVNLSVDKDAILAADSVTTGADGTAKIYITNLKAETANLTARVGQSQQTVAIHFIGDEDAAHVISVTPSSGPYPADGKTPVTYQALVQDNNGNPLPNLDVKWSADNSDIVMSATQSTTNAQGIATITITSSKAVTVVVTAQVNASSKDAVPVTFVADRSQAVISNLTTNKTVFKADNKDRVTAVATVTDNHGNVIPNMSVSWQVTNDANATPLSSMTDENGQAQTVITTAKAGAITITAELDNGQQKTANITAEADANSATIQLQTNKTSLPVDGQTAATLTATVLDQNGNPVANQNVDWQSSLNQLSAQSSVTNAQGQTTVTLFGIRAGQATVSASLDNSQQATQQVVFTALRPDSKQSSFYVMPQHVVADGKTTATGTITVRDMYGNPLIGQHVTVTAPDKAVTISEVTEQGDGVYTVTVSSTKAGSFTLLAKIGEQAPLNLKATATFDADAASAKFSFVTVLPPATVLADGKATVTIRAQLSDAQGNTGLSGVTIHWATDLGTLRANSSITNASGVAEVTISSTQAGQAQVTASLDNGASQAADKKITFQRDISAENSSLTLDHDTIVAGTGVATATITVRDSSNKPVPGIASLVKLSLLQSLPLNIGTITETSAGVYQAKLSGNKAGTVTLQAIVDGVTVQQTAQLTIVADVASAHIKNIIADTASAYVGDTVTYTAYIVDDNGNVVHEPQTVNWSANSDSHLGSTQSQSDSNGQAQQTVTRTIAGVAQVKASIGQQTPVNAADVLFSAGNVDFTKSTVVLNPTTIMADGKDNAILTITLKDKYGNLVDPSQPVSATSSLRDVHFSASSKQSTGVYTITITGTKAGQAQIQAFIGDTKLQAPQSLTLQADQSTWHILNIVTTKSEMMAGDKDGSKYIAMVVDQQGAAVANATVSWKEVSGPTTEFASSSVTDEHGLAQIVMHGNIAGEVILQAKLENGNSKLAPKVLITSQNVPDLSQATFTADTDSITASGEDQVHFKVHLQDQYGNAITGQTVQIMLPNQLSGFRVTPMTMQDQGNGDYTAVGTSITEGQQVVQAFVNNQQIGSNITITVKAQQSRIYFEQSTVTTTYTRLYYQGQWVIGVPGGVHTTWSSSDPSVASITSTTGQITLHKAGTTVITVETDPDSSFGYATASYTLIVEKEQPTLQFTYDAGHTIEYGTPFTLPTVMTTNNDIDINQLELTRSSSDENVATIAQDNRVTINKAGHVIFTVTSAENEQYKSASVTYDLTITKRQLTITFPESKVSFTQEQMQSNPSIYKLNPIENIPADVTLVWSSSNKNVLDIKSTDGSYISHNDAGETTISATVVEDERYMPATGSYDVEIYGTSRIELSSIVGHSLGQASDAATTAWQPFTERDSLDITWNLPAGEDEHEYPSRVDLYLGTGADTVLYHHDYHGNNVKGDTLSIDPEPEWVGKDAWIKIVAYDEDNQPIDTIKHNIKISAVDISKVIESATAKVEHQVYRQDNKVDANVCRVNADEPQNAVYAEWDIQIDTNRDFQRSIFNFAFEVYMNVKNDKTGKNTSQLVASENNDEIHLQDRTDQLKSLALLTDDCWGGASENGRDGGTVTMQVQVTYGGKTFKLQSPPMVWNADSSASTQNGTQMVVIP